MSSVVSYSPLQGLDGVKGINVSLVETDIVKIVLRGKSNNKDFLSTVKKVIGVDLPTTINATATNKKISVTSISPDEWLLTSTDSNGDKLISDLKKTLGSIHSAVVDVSDYYMSLTISGKNSRDVLEKGVVVNLDNDAFPIGYATGTHYEKAVINLHRTDNNSYDVIFRRSFAPYLWGHLVTGAKEFG